MAENRSKERVLRALGFQRPDILPLYENYWPEFLEQWRIAKGIDQADIHALKDYYGDDMATAAANESPWPSRAALIEEGKGAGGESFSISRNGWGSVSRNVEGAHFSDELSAALEERVDPDTLVFESPLLAARYERSDAMIEKHKHRYALFAKTGGPFKRPSLLRGYTQFLIDIAKDPQWARALVERVMDHLIDVGVEQLRRNRSSLVGIQINDDACSLRGPVMGPRAYEKICLPSLRRMVRAYKHAGAAIVYVHCDGNLMPLVDMWVDAGIDAIHPCEPRAGVDVFALRKRHGRKLSYIGAMDNCVILPQGSRSEIEAHVRELADFGRDGGLVLGGHSIGPDIPIEHYEWAMGIRREYGTYGNLER